MGTSTGYDMPKGGDWTPLKHEATKFVKDDGAPGGSPNPVQPEALLSNFIRTCVTGGGNARVGSGGGAGGGGTAASGGGGGGGGGRSFGRAARGTGGALGGFLSRVETVGLDEALREAGLENLIGRSVAEVMAGLLNALAAPAGTLDEHAARKALEVINAEMIGGAKNYAEVKGALKSALDKQGLERIVVNFFGEYLYQNFLRSVYKDWAKKVGADQAGRRLKSIRDCITSALKSKFVNRDISKVRWKGREGRKIIDQVWRGTLKIFGVAP
ncbi:MAG TPA: hypothetical protein VF297_31845 [Pyrinomonadaceae bacterium]